jgi:hypothetical protein
MGLVGGSAVLLVTHTHIFIQRGCDICDGFLPLYVVFDPPGSPKWWRQCLAKTGPVAKCCFYSSKQDTWRRAMGRGAHRDVDIGKGDPCISLG